jgi:periplasmic divalent cation tolerance protein
MASDVVVALCTTPPENARSIATRLVTERLAACVNVVPAVESIYRWEGRIESGAESLLVIKTTSGQLAALAQRLVAIHPYQCPELITLPVTGGLPAYLQWVIASSGDAADTDGPRGATP